MRRILAITSIALHAAIRSRIVLLLMVPLLFGIIGIPLLVKSDGTVAGYVQILLSYSLGFALAILSITTLWSGCAAISSEIDEKQMHMVLSKPVSRMQVWLGKWLAMLVLNGVLLTVTGISVYSILMWRSGAHVQTDEDRFQLDEELLVARRQLTINNDYSQDAPATLERLAKENPLIVQRMQALAGLPPGPPDVTSPALLEQMEYQMLVMDGQVDHGQMRTWMFKLDPKPQKDAPVFLHYSFQSSAFSKRNFNGVWHFGSSGDVPPVSQAINHKSRIDQSVTVPAEAIGEDGTLIVGYLNNHQDGPMANTNEIPTIKFAYDDNFNLEVRYRAGSFLVNFVKAMFMMFCQLAFLAAVGVTMGSLFSLPVATFASSFLLIVQGFSGLLNDFSSQGALPFFRPVYRVLGFLLQPLQGANVFEMLAGGLQISTGYTLLTFFWKIVVYGGFFFLIGSYLFRRREIGLPT